jgi:hypothetical protein
VKQHASHSLSLRHYIGAAVSQAGREKAAAHKLLNRSRVIHDVIDTLDFGSVFTFLPLRNLQSARVHPLGPELSEVAGPKLFDLTLDPSTLDLDRHPGRNAFKLLLPLV